MVIYTFNLRGGSYICQLSYDFVALGATFFANFIHVESFALINVYLCSLLLNYETECQYSLRCSAYDLGNALDLFPFLG